MDLSIYLAFTGAELEAMLNHKGKTAWMGCHLSAYGSGITPPPAALKHCDLLVLTDETPPDGHDPKRVAGEFWAQAQALGCERILLDFQRPPTEESHRIIHQVMKNVTVPVGVTPSYAAQLDCPIFLPPPPLWTPLQEALSPWAGREIWLEIAPEDGCVTLTKDGSTYTPCEAKKAYTFSDPGLCLSYCTEVSFDRATVYLHRDISNIAKWLEHAFSLGIRTAIGLYQQFSTLSANPALQSTDFMV